MEAINKLYIFESATIKPVVDNIPGIDTGILTGLGLGLTLVLSIGWVYLWDKKQNENRDKIINIKYTQDLYNGPDYWNYHHYIIHIFDLDDQKKNEALQASYGLFGWITMRNFRRALLANEGDTEFTVLNWCTYKGRAILGLGFTDNCRLYRELGPLSNRLEEVGTYIPPSCRIKTAWYPAYDIRNFIWCPSILLPYGGGVWVRGPSHNFYPYKLYSGNSPVLTRWNEFGNMEIFIKGGDNRTLREEWREERRKTWSEFLLNVLT